MRHVVRGTAQFFPTAIISGRGREKVESFVQLSELYYAGSHGMDITGPQVGPRQRAPPVGAAAAAGGRPPAAGPPRSSARMGAALTRPSAPAPVQMAGEDGQDGGLRFEAAASFKPLIDQVYSELCRK
jgi:hypothetical protein